MPAAGGQRQRSAAEVPACPGQVGVGAGVQQHRDDPKAASPGDRVVQAAEGVDVDAVLEEPAQAGGVLEVQLVEDQRLEAGLVEQVKERGVRLFAGVVEGVLIAGGTTLDEQPGEREIAAPFDGVAVGVGAGIQQQPRAGADVGGRTDRPSQHTSSGASPSTVVVAAVGSACRSVASAGVSARTSARSIPSSVLACTWWTSLGQLAKPYSRASSCWAWLRAMLRARLRVLACLRRYSSDGCGGRSGTANPCLPCPRARARSVGVLPAVCCRWDRPFPADRMRPAAHAKFYAPSHRARSCWSASSARSRSRWAISLRRHHRVARTWPGGTSRRAIISSWGCQGSSSTRAHQRLW